MTENDFKLFFNLHYRTMIFFAERLLKDKMLTEDVVAESFIKVWEAPHNRNLKSYLFTCVHNSCSNHNKHRNRVGVHKDVFGMGSENNRCIPDQLLDLADPELLMMQSEIINRIVREIESLPVGQQKIARLLKIGFTNREIADLLHLSPHTVGVQINRMRKKLKHLNNRKDVTP